MAAKVVSLENVQINWSPDAQPLLNWLQSEIRRTLYDREGYQTDITWTNQMSANPHTPIHPHIVLTPHLRTPNVTNPP